MLHCNVSYIACATREAWDDYKVLFLLSFTSTRRAVIG